MSADSRPMPVPDLAGLLAPPRRPKTRIQSAELSGEGSPGDAESAATTLSPVVPSRRPAAVGLAQPSVARANVAPFRGATEKTPESAGAAAASGVTGGAPAAGESILSGQIPLALSAEADLGEAVEAGITPIPSPPSAVLGTQDQKTRRTKNESQEGRKDGVSAALPNPQTGRAYLQSKTVYLPRSLHQQLTAEARSRGTTATALILRAVNATHPLIAGAIRAAESPSDGDLFEVAQGHRATEPSVQTSVRITDQQLSAIESLAATHLITRSKLICVALNLFLSQ